MFKIDITKINRDHFVISEVEIAKETCYLIKPILGFDKEWWNKDNLYFRSSLWNSSGNLISGSYPKFFNFDERIDIHPFNGDLTGCSLIEKIDGSTLIISKYKSEFIIRTRGSVNAEKVMTNGKEISYFKDKYKLFFDNLPDTTPYSFIFEWISPNNRIVINYIEPDLILTGIIHHNTYELATQNILDKQANILGFKRPQRFQFNNFKELSYATALFKDKEGICLYYNKDQYITKIKSLWYLSAHAFKSNLSIKSILSLYIKWNCPTKEVFYSNLEKEVDHECLVFAKDLVEDLYNIGVREVEGCFESVKSFYISNLELNQKEFANKLKQSKFSSIEKAWCFSYRKNINGNFNNYYEEIIDNTLRNKQLLSKMSYNKMVLLKED